MQTIKAVIQGEPPRITEPPDCVSQHVHFVLRERNDDISAAGGSHDRLVDLASDRSEIDHIGPKFDRKLDQGIRQHADADSRRRLLQYARIVRQHLPAPGALWPKAGYGEAGIPGTPCGELLPLSLSIAATSCALIPGSQAE